MIQDYKLDNIQTLYGDCLERMKEILRNCKNDMLQEDWNNLKLNIEEYFI